MEINRGEIYFVRLDPAVGFEIGGGKARPAIVLSINDINRKPLVISVVPGTSTVRDHRNFRNVVIVEPTHENGLRTLTAFQCHQVRAIDKQRLSPSPVGRIAPKTLYDIEEAVRFSLGLGPG